MYRNVFIGCLFLVMMTWRVAGMAQGIPGAVVDTVSHGFLQHYDSAAGRLNARIDSLGNVGLSGDRYVRQVDSLYASFGDKDLAALRKTYAGVSREADARMAALDSVVAVRRKFLDSLVQASGLGPLPALPNAGLTLPAAGDIPGTALPVVPALDVPAINIPRAGLSLPNADISLPDVSLPKGLGSVQDLAAEAGTLGEKAGEAGAVVAGVKQEGLGAAVDGAAGQQAERLAGASGLTDQMKAAEAAKAAVMPSEEATKEALKETAKQEFVDHFAGHEAVVQKDMESIAKVQMKYRTVNDSRELPKRVPNAMKGKPLRERLIPAIGFQVISAEHVSIDLAPSVGYRLSGRLRAGVGAFRRLTYFKHERVLRAEDVYGFRLYGDVKIRLQLNVHLEPELFRDDRPNAKPPGTDRRGAWERRVNLGVLKMYSVGKHFTGTVTVLYDVLSLKEFPNTRGGGVRVGVEWRK